jgi:hypothetical protein
MEEDLEQVQQKVVIGKSYVSSYTGPEIDAGITKAYQTEYTYTTAEEINDPVDVVRNVL